MKEGIDLSPLYKLRKDFTIIALTTRTGSGATTVARKIEKGFKEEDYPEPSLFDRRNNSYRKYEIIYNFARENFRPHAYINYREVLTTLILHHTFEEFVTFLESNQVKEHITNSNFALSSNFSDEIKELGKLKSDFRFYEDLVPRINFKKAKEGSKKIYEFFFGKAFIEFSERLHTALKSIHFAKHNLVFQLITNNLRRSGNYSNSSEVDSSNIYTIAKVINAIIKSVRTETKSGKVVIDSLRNPFEVLFFKQRYAAFYLMAVNIDEKRRQEELKNKYKEEYEIICELLEQEYKGGKPKEFYRQNVRSCIEKADVHISFRTEQEIETLNKQRDSKNDKTSPYYTWEMQVLKFLSLIEKPGLITPSPEERCMQLAFTAKFNSGCISRQVGAAITDGFYSVKAIGWNNTPEGQVPCLLRNSESLLNATKAELQQEETEQTQSLQAFTPYEKSNKTFNDALTAHFKDQITLNRKNLKGRNVPFCFKTLQNSCSEGKNQVHTRSLHAEESAFLQITKYGGTAIKDGKLFTTASPCELCSKKAYQLGISVIYYIDPYPGISRTQILEAGTKRPEVRLFNGAIGSAYYWLYEPLMSYKEELALILNQNIEDLTSIQKRTIDEQNKRIKELEQENENLKRNGI